MQKIYLQMQAMSVEEQTALLDALLQWSEKDVGVRPTHRVMNAGEVVRLSEGGAISIGAHTENHSSLPARPIDDQRKEIRRSKALLEEWLGHSIEGFAYPYGHSSQETAEEVRRAEFAYACACGGRPVRRDSDTHLLPRIDAPDVSGDSFERQLRSHFGR